MISKNFHLQIVKKVNYSSDSLVLFNVFAMTRSSFRMHVCAQTCEFVVVNRNRHSDYRYSSNTRKMVTKTNFLLKSRFIVTFTQKTS